jgi:UDP-GlcNAc:undecaprenyl-phosphate GlcNAc-1-phosphate transferase
MILAQADAANAAHPVGLLQIIAPYMAVFFVAFLVSIVLTPLMRLLAVRNGVVDWPDLNRKNHLQPVAYLGGVAIFLGWLAGIALCFFVQPHNNSLLGIEAGYVSFPLSIILGAAAITLTGLFDDVYGISPRVKIGGQLFAAAALASQDVGTRLVESSLAVVGFGTVPEPVVYLLGTAVIATFVIGGCNALNLLDGLDGLAAGVAGIATTGFLVIAGLVALRSYDAATDEGTLSMLNDPVRIVMCLAILGAILGFLPYNFNPATIFMGDAGSLLLGYLCVSTVLLFAETKGNGLLLVTAALIVFALPITDTLLAIFRRKIQGKPIFSPDSQHIHHLLRRSGLSVKQSVLTLYGVAILFAVIGCSMVAMQLRWRYLMAVFVVLFGFIVVTAFKYGQRQALLQNAADASAAAPHATAVGTQPAPANTTRSDAPPTPNKPAASENIPTHRAG